VVHGGLRRVVGRLPLGPAHDEPRHGPLWRLRCPRAGPRSAGRRSARAPTARSGWPPWPSAMPGRHVERGGVSARAPVVHQHVDPAAPLQPSRGISSAAPPGGCRPGRRGRGSTLAPGPAPSRSAGAPSRPTRTTAAPGLAEGAGGAPTRPTGAAGDDGT